jgi:hypothetical protein
MPAIVAIDSKMRNLVIMKNTFILCERTTKTFYKQIFQLGKTVENLLRKAD